MTLVELYKDQAEKVAADSEVMNLIAHSLGVAKAFQLSELRTYEFLYFTGYNLLDEDADPLTDSEMVEQSEGFYTSVIEAILETTEHENMSLEDRYILIFSAGLLQPSVSLDLSDSPMNLKA